MMRESRPDTIIALGGGSVLDAAKIMRLFYDWPNLTLKEVAVNFLDFRHRVAEFPKEVSTPLVAIPTTSGTGSEVTPFAVFKDNNTHRKVSLVDESLLPNIAIIDANLTRSLPKDLTIDTAVDALTHSLEALVSVLASDYTDGLALEAMRLIFEALPECVENGNDVLWRHKLHNASCLAGMAIGNASVGVNHALAHSLGAKYDIPHGRANGVFLLSTIEFNASIPRKFCPHSAYMIYVADKKYARAAQFLGLPEANPKGSLSDNITALRRAVYDLLVSLGQPTSIEELGISQDAFNDDFAELVRNSMEDLSGRTNPRMVMVSEIAELFLSSYPKRSRP
jgi:acetaldehyde dehydrogenase/alcohol dehydrogenase